MTKRTTIIDFVNEYVDKYQNETYLREKVDGVWTETSFIKTRDEARLIAAGFMSLGLNKGDKVSLLAEARPMWVITEFGILFAGGVDVPLSYKLESDYDLTFRINHSDSRFIVASEMEIEKVRRVIAQCPAIEKVIVMDDIPLQEGEIYLKDVREAGVKFIEEHPGELEARMASVGPDDYANISYTSGTTADPKGILLTHRNYTANVAQGASVISIDRGDIMLIILPMDHCFAHVAGLYTMMSYGGSIATVPGKTPQAQLRNIIPTMKEIKPQVMLTVPAISRSFKKAIENGVKAKGKTTEKLYNMALKNARAYYKDYYNQGGAQFWRKPFVKLFDKIIFSKIRETFGGKMKFCVGGCALLDIELQRYFCAIGMPTFQGYGLSEATPIICSNAPGFARFGSSGRIVSPMECTIRDDENRILPNGQTGEIVIKGENVMAGYWKNPEATAETIVDGWLHTGDRGYICKEDPRYLYVTGRFKSLLISSDGEKYSPEGYEDNLAVVSKYIDNVILHNNQSPYTIVLVVPNKEALRAAAPGDKEAQLRLIQADVDSYRKGGIRAGRFPEKWLPTAIVVCEEPFTEKNGLVNSTGKVVRGKVEKHFEKRIEYAYTPEGKQLINPQNMAALD